MDAVKRFFGRVEDFFKDTMGGILGLFSPELSEFQKKKLLHEFYTFFDLNKDGKLEWSDFDMAREKICQMSGWKPGTDKYMKTRDLFVEIWRKLQDEADENNDGKVTAEEWVKMWENYNKECAKKKDKDEDAAIAVPPWLLRYAEYKFHLYDRTGDGEIDIDEFEYVLSDFGISPKDAKVAFVMISQNHQKKVDLEYFKELSAEYYRSNDPGALGNFITGRLDFSD